MGSPQWATPEVFKTLEGRIEHIELIENNVADWVRGQSRDKVFTSLQKANVPCGPMIIGMEMLDDPHLEARGWTLEIDQPGVGYMKLEGPAWMSESMGGPITFPAPDLAGHTREIASEVLKMDQSEVEDLIERGVLEV